MTIVYYRNDPDSLAFAVLCAHPCSRVYSEDLDFKLAAYDGVPPLAEVYGKDIVIEHFLPSSQVLHMLATAARTISIFPSALIPDYAHHLLPPNVSVWMDIGLPVYRLCDGAVPSWVPYLDYLRSYMWVTFNGQKSPVTDPSALFISTRKQIDEDFDRSFWKGTDDEPECITDSECMDQTLLAIARQQFSFADFVSICGISGVAINLPPYLNDTLLNGDIIDEKVYAFSVVYTIKRAAVRAVLTIYDPAVTSVLQSTLQQDYGMSVLPGSAPHALMIQTTLSKLGRLFHQARPQ